ncbi:hypothetical protein HK102_007347, partial [Quaeritorhiza haematococci]
MNVDNATFAFKWSSNIFDLQSSFRQHFPSTSVSIGYHVSTTTTTTTTTPPQHSTSTSTSEAIQITFNTSLVKFPELLRHYLQKHVSIAQVSGQPSVVFYTSDQQGQMAISMLRQLGHHFVQVERAGTFVLPPQHSQQHSQHHHQNHNQQQQQLMKQDIEVDDVPYDPALSLMSDLSTTLNSPLDLLPPTTTSSVMLSPATSAMLSPEPTSILSPLSTTSTNDFNSSSSSNSVSVSNSNASSTAAAFASMNVLAGGGGMMNVGNVGGMGVGTHAVTGTTTQSMQDSPVLSNRSMSPALSTSSTNIVAASPVSTTVSGLDD